MNKLSKEKRDQLILVVLLALMALGGLYFGLIRYQYGVLAELGTKISTATKRSDDVDRTVKHALQIREELEQDTRKLAALESGMATGDLSFWSQDLIFRFTHSYKVDIPQVGRPVVADNTVALLPDLPYREAIFAVSGTAYYHELGKFIADFENQYPHMRLLNLQIEPMPSQIAGDKDKEKLSFSMNIVTLIKPSSS